jgi:nucleoside-diphosphate-sugar epimerase
MKILFTGGSSFTGFWFVKELASRGHQITAIARGDRHQYTGLRKERMDQVADWAEPVWNCSFGDETFMGLLDRGFDIVCHHGAQVENYKSPDFDIAAALRSNTLQARLTLEKMRASGMRLVVTGSVFEAGEGLGNPPMVAFSPYGLSKSISWEVFRYWCWKLSLPLIKFVVPNPFGPFEEPRFCNYLVKTWMKGETPTVGTPDYIRDNIHVSLLASHYAQAVELSAGQSQILRYGPTGYIESQGAFAERFTREMASRLPIRCQVMLGKQLNFDEPMIRTNDPANLVTSTTSPGSTIHAAAAALEGWDEQKAWDELAGYYISHVLNPVKS